MNVRKPVNYSAMFSALDSLMEASLPQMELYCEIDRLVSDRKEKGAAVAAAEYLSKAYPNASGFSPRNLRRMRDFCRAYGDTPEVMAGAMTIGWTKNAAILEGCEVLEERGWYIQSVRRFGWTKAELLEKIRTGIYQESTLDLAEEMCYTEENAAAKEAPWYEATQDTQRDGTGNAGSENWISPFLWLFHPRLFHGGMYFQPLLVCQRSGRPMGVENGTGPPGQSRLRQTLLQKSQTGYPEMAPGSCQLPVRRIRFRRPLRGRFGESPGKANHGDSSPGMAYAVQGSEAAGRIWTTVITNLQMQTYITVHSFEYL